MFAPLVLSMSCRGLLDYGAVTFEDTDAEPGNGGAGGDSGKPDVVFPKGGAGGSGATGGSGAGGTIMTGGTAGGGTGGTIETGGSAGNGGSTGAGGTGGGSPATCNNSICESGEDCSNCPADCVCATDTTCVFASPPGAWTCICTGNGFCTPGTCKSDRCNCTGADGGIQICDPGKGCSSGGCAP